MPYEHAGTHESVLAEGVGFELPHAPDCGERPLEVVPHPRVPQGDFGGKILEVGQKDIDEFRRALDGLLGLVGVRVPDDGHSRTIEGKRLFDFVQVMRGRDEVDVVRALRLKVLKDLREFGGSNCLSDLVAADLIILAKDAAERAPAEKDGARPVRAGDRGLLEEMEVRPCDFEFPCAAEPGSSGSFRAAVSRTKRADHMNSFLVRYSLSLGEYSSTMRKTAMGTRQAAVTML